MAFESVKLRAYGGEVITRVAVREDGDVVLVCRESELRAAQSQGREPTLVGFSKRDLVQGE